MAPYESGLPLYVTYLPPQTLVEVAAANGIVLILLVANISLDGLDKRTQIKTR